MKGAKNPEEYFEKTTNFRQEQLALREILQSTELEETIKWGIPCYTLEGKNLIGLSAFKAYFGLWFYQGALLKDDKKKLINAQEGKTVAMRQWRFNSAEEIDEKLIRSYIAETIAHQKAGREIKAKRNKPLIIPPELRAAMKADPALKKNFEAMNLTNRRIYAEYIAEAKQEATKARRLEKIIPLILANKGLHDKYK